MSSKPSRPRSFAGEAFIAITALALVLTGCAAASAPAPTPVKTKTAEPTPAHTTHAPVPSAINCDDVLPTAVLDSALGGTFTLTTSYVPTAGSPAAQIAGAGGVACEWTEESGATVLAAAGEPGASIIASGKSEAARAGTPIDTFGASLTAYQSGQGGTVFDIFSDGGAWVQTTSSLYASPSDVTGIVEQIMQALPSG